MSDLDEWLTRVTIVLGIATAISKETRAWLEYKKKRPPKPRKWKR
ncbi:hypothetical protein [Streptococcus parauberis]